MPNEIAVTVKAKESGLAKIEQDARQAGARVGSELEGGFDKAGRAAQGAGKKIGDGLGEAERAAKQAGAGIDKSFEAALNSVRSDLDRMEQEAWQAAAGMDEAFTTNLRSMRAELDRLERAGEQTGAGLESSLGGALRDVREDAQRLSGEMGSVGADWGGALSEGMSGGLDMGGLLDSLTGGLGPAATAALGVGAAIGAAIWSGAEAVWEQHEVGGLIAAQNRGTVAQARELGDLAGDAFYDGFGESVQDVGVALSAVIGTGLSDMDAPAAELDRLTRMAVTASQVVGEEASAIGRAAQQLLRTDLAQNAEQAIDIIVGASQAGINISGDLLDTITEYSTQFRVLGLDAPSALGLVSQAMKAGARDSDIAADALKEFAIRAQDGSELTANGFRALGLDARKMADEVGAGGDRASSALDLTLDKLREIPDPVQRSQVAVALFGTQAEDMADALHAMDLDTAAEQMDAFQGATDAARATLAGTMPPLESLSRGFEGFLNSTLEGIKLGDIDIFGGTSIKQVEEGTDVFEDLRAVIAEKLPLATGTARAGMAALGDEFDESSSDGLGLIETLDEIMERERAAAGEVLSMSEAQIAYHESVDAANAALEKNGENLDLTTEAGRENRSVLNDLAESSLDVAEAMVEQGMSAEDVQAHMENARREFLRVADAMGLDARQAGVLADQLGLVPGDYRANVHADTGNAERAVARVGSALSWLDGRSATVHVGAVGSALGLRTGGIVGSGLQFEHGGIVGAGAPWGAATGGQRHSSTVIDEAGPEVVDLPSGARVATAGATRAMAEAGWLGGGGGEQRMVLELRSGGSRMDDLLVEMIQRAVKVRGGDVVKVLGGR